MTRKALTPRQKKLAATKRLKAADDRRRETFCQQYVLTQNATQSYLAANPKVKETSAATEGWRLLRNPEILQRIKELKIQGHDHLMVSFEETLQEIAGQAMFDPINMFDENGKLLLLHEMDPVTRKMVNEIEVIQGTDDSPLGIAKIKYGKEKRGYLDMLMKYHNAYSEHQRAGGGIIQVMMYCAQDADL